MTGTRQYMNDLSKNTKISFSIGTLLAFIVGFFVLFPGAIPQPVFADDLERELRPMKTAISAIQVAQTGLSKTVLRGFKQSELNDLKQQLRAVARHKAAYKDNSEVQRMDTDDMVNLEAAIKKAECELIQIDGGVCAA